MLTGVGEGGTRGGRSWSLQDFISLFACYCHELKCVYLTIGLTGVLVERTAPVLVAASGRRGNFFSKCLLL